ncbi:MAG: hypothetical protein MR400_01590 [Clostridiales bacterium]|nr:hypothetical protein [Clostridiales bacterium]
MDNFMEEVVTKRNRGMQTALFVIANILWVLLALYAFLLLQGLSMALAEHGFSTALILYIVEFLLFGGAALLLFLRRDRIKTEYEYTFTNGQMDFAQVFNNKKRKALGTMNIRNVEACGLVSSGSFQRYINQQGIKRTNWFLNRDAELLYFYFQKEGAKRIIIIEPSADMIALIKKYLPQGIWQNN